jgi:hypothetical protein
MFAHLILFRSKLFQVDGIGEDLSSPLREACCADTFGLALQKYAPMLHQI